MADTTTNTDGAAEAAPAADTGSGESFDSQTANDDQGTADDGTDGDESGDEDDSGDDEDFQDDGSEPTTRRDNSYFIGLRHGKKAAKTAQKPQDDDQGDGDDDDSDDDDGLDPEDQELLNGAIQKAVAPLTEKLAAEEDAKELGNFISQNPQLKPYQAKIERFMKHESRKHLPIETVAMEAIGMQKMLQLGAKLGRQSGIKKGSSGSGPSGGGKRGGSPAKSVSEMSEAEFAAYQNEVRSKM